MDVSGADDIALDWRVAAHCARPLLLAAPCAGVTPAWQLSRPAAALPPPGQQQSIRPRRPARLVVVEVCLALLLTVGAGLLVRSLHEIQRVDPGFERDAVFALQVFAWDRNDTPPKLAAFFEQCSIGMRALPGVAAAGAVSAMPFIEANINIRSSIAISGKPPAAPGDDALVSTTIVARRLLPRDEHSARARPAAGSDRSAETRKVAVISRSAAAQVLAGRAIRSGRRCRFGSRARSLEARSSASSATPGTTRSIARRAPEMFLAHPQMPFGSMTFVVRTAAGSPASLPVLKEQVWAVDPLQAFYRTGDARRADLAHARRPALICSCLTGFGLAALLLAAPGCTA